VVGDRGGEDRVRGVHRVRCLDLRCILAGETSAGVDVAGADVVDGAEAVWSWWSLVVVVVCRMVATVMATRITDRRSTIMKVDTAAGS
jgi:hypothetical protein